MTNFQKWRRDQRFLEVGREGAGKEVVGVIKGQYNRDPYGDGSAQFPDSGGGYSNTHEIK